jgi:hypothetical protein
MRGHVVTRNGNLLAPPWAIANLRVVHVCDVTYKVWEVGWKVMAVEVDVHHYG